MRKNGGNPSYESQYSELELLHRSRSRSYGPAQRILRNTDNGSGNPLRTRGRGSCGPQTHIVSFRLLTNACKEILSARKIAIQGEEIDALLESLIWQVNGLHSLPVIKDGKLDSVGSELVFEGGQLRPSTEKPWKSILCYGMWHWARVQMDLLAF